MNLWVCFLAFTIETAFSHSFSNLVLAVVIDETIDLFFALLTMEVNFHFFF
jgi:hypothetical protein